MLTLALALKLAGTALLFSSVAALSYMNKKSDGLRLRRLRGQIEFVKFIRDRIERYLSPISEILRDCDPSVIADVLIGCSDEAFYDIEGMRSILSSGRYCYDGGRIFDSFLSALGSSYRENEIAACEGCIKDLGEIAQKLKKELPRERKSRSVLLFCLAAAIVIILF